jgi:23S rRNA (pseudouridine1915-N3)-methyltransferase
MAPRIRVVFLGEDKRDPLQQAAADYLERAGRRYAAVLDPKKPARRKASDDDDKARLLEAEVLLAASEGCTRVALDAEGTLHASSHAFARALEELLARGKPVCFLLGGATGLHESVKTAATQTWSLSRLTYAHRLAILVLAEQVYRAAEIERGGPYAK